MKVCLVPSKRCLCYQIVLVYERENKSFYLHRLLRCSLLYIGMARSQCILCCEIYDGLYLRFRDDSGRIYKFHARNFRIIIKLISIHCYLAIDTFCWLLCYQNFKKSFMKDRYISVCWLWNTCNFDCHSSWIILQSI